MKKGGITRSTGFQVLLYFVLAVGALCGCFCILMTVWLWDWGAHEVRFAEFEKRMMTSEAYEHLTYICEDDYSFATLEDMIEAFRAESAENNVKYAIYDGGTDEIIWTNTSSIYQNSYYSYECFFGRRIGSESLTLTMVTDVPAEVTINELTPAEEVGPDSIEEVTYETSGEEYQEFREFRVVLYVDASVAKDDDFRQLHNLARFWYYQLDTLYVGILVSCVVLLICLIWILCNAGHRWHREGIVPGVFCNIYLDIFTALWGVVTLIALVAGVALFDEIYTYQSDFSVAATVISVGVALGAVWCTIYLREVALRFKLGKWWKHTLIYQLCKVSWKFTKFMWKCLVKLVVNLPEIHLVVIALVFITACEFLGIMKFVRWGREDLLSLWFVEKLVVIPLVLYCALAFAKLRKGSRALAQGDLSCKLDTQYLMLHFKEHAEDLNQIGGGISKAVEERLQSERLKTELITNVSHDLKTPLTSVINYADLLAVAAAGEGEDKDAQIQEYSEVLLRQAGRLKKLLEDLVEASKAATGNVELQLVPCELGVILTQAAGEYEERMAEKQLKLIMKKPEEEIRILADGRQLWRVIENLMNNICKYAQESSRVYVSMEKKEDRVELIFRNISKYELDIAPEELTERFVRGDASRHMEGSGLGLSIAKSLVELQNGALDIFTDGDLFKVILSFEIYE